MHNVSLITNLRPDSLKIIVSERIDEKWVRRKDIIIGSDFDIKIYTHD